jgi:hypothetical protein
MSGTTLSIFKVLANLAFKLFLGGGYYLHKESMLLTHQVICSSGRIRGHVHYITLILETLPCVT